MRETIDYYNNNAESFISGTLNADMRETRDRFLRHVKTGGIILDAGCGSGRDAQAFQKSGFQVDAFDASEEICRIASDLLGFPVACRRFEDLTGENEYDGIWACASLLHVEASDLPDVMERLNQLLKPDGVIYFSFKEGDKEWVKDGRYFHNMTAAGCCKLLEETGFEVLDIFETGDVREGRSEERWVNAIGKKSSENPLKTIKVTAAIIMDGQRVFATQRGYGTWKDYWEFPGGKIEPGETPEEALYREIREELDTDIAIEKKLTTIEYDYPEFHLSMDCFFAKVIEGNLELKEHESAKWLKADELDSVRWLPADKIIIDLLKELSL